MGKRIFCRKKRIEAAVKPDIVGIHHIGSTAIANLRAKPIIDIALELVSFQDGEKYVKSLEKLGYIYHGQEILPDRYYFTKGEPRTHQIHMYESGNKYLLEQLNFRDYLRENPEMRQEYEILKQKLALANKDNKHKYAKAKTTYIQNILKIQGDTHFE